MYLQIDISTTIISTSRFICLLTAGMHEVHTENVLYDLRPLGGAHGGATNLAVAGPVILQV